jgi:hypothetical protein
MSWFDVAAKRRGQLGEVRVSFLEVLNTPLACVLIGVNECL